MSEVTFSGNTIGDKALYRTGVERGKKDEQERIIKILEDAGYPPQTIALFKGNDK